VNARSTLVADRQTPKAMQPGDGALDDPTGTAQPAAVWSAALGELRGNPAPRQLVAVRLRIVGGVALHDPGFPPGSAGAPAHRGHGVHQRQQLGDVVPIGGRQRRDERNPVRVGENMMLRPGFAAIGRVRSSFFPPRTARSEALSTTARARSNWPRCRNSSSNTRCSRFHTPARCQRRRRRQQVVPEPHPSSWGNMFHGMPLRSTNKIPVSTARSGIGVRPAYRRLRGRRFGSSGSIRLHKSSSMRGLGRPDHLLGRSAERTKRLKKVQELIS
jgi:hypothetical protein